MLNRKQALIDVFKLLTCLTIAVLIALVLINTTDWPTWQQGSVAGLTGSFLYWVWKQDHFRKLVLFFATPDYSQYDAESEGALDVIEKHGMKAHFYLPGVGNRDNSELSHALDLLSSRGFIITDSSGSRIVGKVATARPCSSEVAKSRRATFKLLD